MLNKPHRRSDHSLTFWKATPHPFMPRAARPKDCSLCDLGQSNDIHIEPERQPHTKKQKKKKVTEE